MTNGTSARWAHKSQIQEPVEALNQTAKPQLNTTQTNKTKQDKTPPILTESAFFYNNSMNSGYRLILANKRIWIWVSLLLFKRWTYRLQPINKKRDKDRFPESSLLSLIHCQKIECNKKWELEKFLWEVNIGRPTFTRRHTQDLLQTHPRTSRRPLSLFAAAPSLSSFLSLLLTFPTFFNLWLWLIKKLMWNF